MKMVFIAFLIGICLFCLAVMFGQVAVRSLLLSTRSIEPEEVYVSNIENKAVAFNINPVEAYKNIGASHLKQGQLDKAILAFKQALQINPRSVEVHYLLADSYSIKGEGVLSRIFLNQAMALEGSYIIDTKVMPEIQPTVVEFPSPIQLPHSPEFFQRPVRQMDAPPR